MTGDELKDIRHRLELTQGALSDRLGVTTRCVQRWEGSERKIPQIAVNLLRFLVAYTTIGLYDDFEVEDLGDDIRGC